MEITNKAREINNSTNVKPFSFIISS